MTTENDDFEVIVVGGGPAGAAVAAWLARAGHAVALLDRARFPRDKACGEFLTPGTQPLLMDLGVWTAAVAAGLSPLSATVLNAPDGRQVRHTPAEGGPAGYTLRRTVLDALLLQGARKAGVDVLEGCGVRTLLREEGGAVIGITAVGQDGSPCTLHARLVIGADGTHSLVARQLGLVRSLPRLQRVALVSHWQGLPGPGDAIEMRASGDLVCGLGQPAVSRREVFHLNGMGRESDAMPSAAANLTLVVPTAQAAKIAGRAGEFLEQTLLERFPDLAARLAGATREGPVRTVGCFGHRCRPAVADGALLVGDAASFIDPFTGEGVYMGLRGAQLAAETAHEALKQGDTSCRRLMPYSRARRELARRYLLIDLVQSVVRAPALLNRVVRQLHRFPDVADRLLSVLGDRRPAEAILHPTLLWRLLLG